MDDLHYIAEIYPSTTRFVNERALRGKKKKKKRKFDTLEKGVVL